LHRYQFRDPVEIPLDLLQHCSGVFGFGRNQPLLLWRSEHPQYMTAFMGHQVVDDRIMLRSVEDDMGGHGLPGNLHRGKGIQLILLNEP